MSGLQRDFAFIELSRIINNINSMSKPSKSNPKGLEEELLNLNKTKIEIKINY